MSITFWETCSALSWFASHNSINTITSNITFPSPHMYTQTLLSQCIIMLKWWAKSLLLEFKVCASIQDRNRFELDLMLEFNTLKEILKKDSRRIHWSCKFSPASKSLCDVIDDGYIYLEFKRLICNVIYNLIVILLVWSGLAARLLLIDFQIPKCTMAGCVILILIIVILNSLEWNKQRWDWRLDEIVLCRDDGVW